MPVAERATAYLKQLTEGDSTATDRLLPLVYNELRSLAERFMRQERPDHTLQPTALVHEAYIRLVNDKQVDWQGRSHFYAIAARCIREILINHAHAHRTAKRGGGAQRLTLHTQLAASPEPNRIDLLNLDEALAKLHALHERQARVVELRFFGGLGVEETAEVLGVAPRTVKSDWRFARAWLRSQLLEDSN